MKTATTDPIAIDDVGSLAGLFRERTRRTPDAVAYRYYDTSRNVWTDVSWRDVGALVRRWQDALRSEGLAAGDRVAVMLPNSLEWVSLDLAAHGLGLVVVPVFANDRPDNVAYILDQTAARLLLIGGNEQTDELCRTLEPFEQLRIVVRSNGNGHRVIGSDPRRRALREWLPDTANGEPEIAVAGPDELATIVFTSGTIGRPKGVMLSHRNILSNIDAAYREFTVHTDDLFLSFLPLSHMLERTAGYYLPMMAGATVAFARSVTQLAEDLVQVKPTALISVPRIYERVNSRLGAQIAERSAIARTLFRWTVDTGWNLFEYYQGRRGWRPSLLLWPVLQRAVAGKVLVRFGGRLRIAVCGGAPLSPDVARVFIGLGLPVVQGYGMTELSPVVSVNRLDDNDPASVGRPLPDVEVRISDAGELLVRSPGRMSGYLNDPDATANTIDDEGWLHTGDKAEIRDGRLYITGRLKDIIVLSNGEKVPPDDIELAIARDPLIEQAMVVGEGKPYLGALIVLNPEQWPAFAQRLGVDPGDPQALNSSRVQDEVCKRIGETMKEFPGYAQVRRCALTLEPWTVENGLLTPTLKLRRPRVTEKMSDEIEQLYAGH